MKSIRSIRAASALFLIALSPLVGCMDLDAFVHNNRHCSTLTEADCDDLPEHYDPAWDRLCASCDEPYDWTIEYEWVEGTLEAGQTIRPITSDVIINDRLDTDDGLGTLDAYFIPSHGEVPSRAQTTILYSHGNFAGIEHYLPRLRVFHEAGFNVLVWDYRGYGKSEPSSGPDSQQFLADALLIREWANTHTPDPDKVIVYGISLGAIPSVEMAINAPSEECALILEVPFTSLNQVTKANTGTSLGEAFLSQGRYGNRDKIADHEGPLLVMHGTEDALFPLEDVQELYDNAPGPKEMWVVEGAQHGIGEGVFDTAGYAAYMETISTFLDETSDACLTE